MDFVSTPSLSTELRRLDSFDSYVNYARSIPRLNETEEIELFRRYQEEGDLEATKQIILSHLRFVVHIAKSYRGYGLPMEDIVQEGNVGLMKSVKRFDLDQGVRFATFAVHWIKSEINEFVLKNWRIVKVATTKAKRKLFFNLKSFKKSIGWLSEAEVTDIAQELGVEKEEVRQVDASISNSDQYFNLNSGENQLTDTSHSLANPLLLEDFSTTPEKLITREKLNQNQRHWLKSAIQILDERSRDIIESRWLYPEGAKLKLADLSERHGISQERVRQIEKSALTKMKKQLESGPDSALLKEQFS